MSPSADRPMFACLHGHGWPSPLAAAECDCTTDTCVGYD